jgi:uroporphyrin-III C-methyltransferase/precorrin-2 dehydrogenase/sirohydrochlorin ferrochelatase
MAARRPGYVWLVGAGPGDPELLTRKAARCLEEADLVLYDALVSSEVLPLAPRAQCFSVGKRCGGRGVRQETIQKLMIRAARRGKRVVRLKCGDPFVLGRGGEEAIALAVAGVPFEVVPGVTTAVAAPALAGVPVTHRGLASGFAVVSGHDERAYEPILRSLPPDSLTVVVLMGLRTRNRLAATLIEAGWAPATPAAMILGASTASPHAWIGTLDTLATAPLPAEAADPPGTIVIGRVVSLSSILAPRAESSASAHAAGERRTGG